MIVGLGNPLLDIIISADDDFLKRHNIKANDAILTEDPEGDICREVEEKNPEFFVGGANQNSIRVAKCILKEKCPCVAMGCVGTDSHGLILEKKAVDDGVICKYQYNSETPTGFCNVVLTKGGQCRSMVTYLGASKQFTIDHLQKPDVDIILKEAKIFYVTGYFYSVCVDAIYKLGEISTSSGKTCCMNISAPFLCCLYIKEMIKALQYVDIVFGNEEEALQFSKEANFGVTDIKKIALKLSDLPKANDIKRLAVITQGADEVIVAQDGNIKSYKVNRIPSEKIVDTTGAGDAFVGGYLSQLVMGKNTEDCVKCGIWAASQIIQRVGCNFPKKLDYDSISNKS